MIPNEAEMRACQLDTFVRREICKAGSFFCDLTHGADIEAPEK